jgi:hypothetical protein
VDVAVTLKVDMAVTEIVVEGVVVVVVVRGVSIQVQILPATAPAAEHSELKADA